MVELGRGVEVENSNVVKEKVGVKEEYQSHSQVNTIVNNDVFHTPSALRNFSILSIVMLWIT